MSADAFWRPFEKTASSFDEVADTINDVFLRWTTSGRQFAWRGQVDASWPLHSSLFRRLMWTNSSAPDEEALFQAEEQIFTDFRRWGLHRTQIGRLSALAQLALMQHYGTPTRLLDVTFNPFVGLWFAVEEKWANAATTSDGADGRLFAFDVTSRLINENEDKRDWEDDPAPPWRSGRDSADDWRVAVHAWRPPRFEDRISSQNGGFLLGGSPASSAAGRTFQCPKTTDSAGGWWSIEETRGFTSVALRPHKLETVAGAPPDAPVYTIRITSGAKREIRERLERLHGYTHSTMYPDLTGFASYATPYLKSCKP